MIAGFCLYNSSKSYELILINSTENIAKVTKNRLLHF